MEKARLILIPKGTPSEDEVPKTRPICLLMDVAKLLERIIASKMNAWMDVSEDVALSGDQYGFGRWKVHM